MSRKNLLASGIEANKLCWTFPSTQVPSDIINKLADTEDASETTVRYSPSKNPKIRDELDPVSIAHWFTARRCWN